MTHGNHLILTVMAAAAVALDNLAAEVEFEAAITGSG